MQPIVSPVLHRTIEIDGVNIFYREVGREESPVVLLPHGYPSSSFQFRNFMPALADRWRLIAPDYPGFGYSDTPARFAYTFDGYADFLERFTTTLNLNRYALYLHDYGSQIGLRLAIKAPLRIAALIIQNGDIYEDELGPKYEALKKYWESPTPQGRERLRAAVSEEGFRDEFVGEVDERLVDRISPDLWKLSWPLMQSLERREIAVGLMEGLRENLQWFPKYQAYLREHQPPTLIVWGPQDGYMPAGAARAYLRDLPDAELHLLDGGHWALETNLDEIVELVRDFLGRVHANDSRRPDVSGAREVVGAPGVASQPQIARIWRGRTMAAKADQYAPYLYEEGIKPLEEKALGVQLFREDRATESEFVTISYWETVEAMSRFAGDDPRQIHHLPRDAEFLIELPDSVQILNIISSTGNQ
jgi:pimeloyl-ACP methyl ester carboxylesterase